MKGATLIAFSFKNVLFVSLFWIEWHLSIALDIPYEVLTAVSEFHCFEEFRRCLSPWEYCDSKHRECRPCSESVCSGKEDEVPLMCRLNCTVTDVLLKGKTESNVIESRPYIWFVGMIIGLSASIVLIGCWIIKYRSTLQKWFRQLLLFSEKKPKAPHTVENVRSEVSGTGGADLESALSDQEPGHKAYCEDKLKGTCATNEDNTVVIQTTVSPSPKATDLTTRTDAIVTEEAAVPLLPIATTHVELDKSVTTSKKTGTNLMNTGLNSEPLKNAPTLDPTTLEKEVIVGTDNI